MGLNRNINDDSTLAYLFNKTRQGASDALQKAVDKINAVITTITTNMPEWIDANIGYVDSETPEDKLARLLTGTYLPRGKAFIGRVLTGERYFVAGQLYEAGGQLYGSVVFNGVYSNHGGLYAIMQGSIYKQSIRPDDVVMKAGDTMTGNLNIENTWAGTIAKKTDLSSTSASYSSYVNSAGFRCVDKDDNAVALYTDRYETNGRTGAYISGFKKVGGTNQGNYLMLLVDNNADPVVSMSAPAAWRSALNAVNKAGDTMTGNLDVFHNNPAVMLKDNSADTSLSSDTTDHIWTFGHRDKNDKYAAYLQSTLQSNGRINLVLSARRIVSGSNVDNSIILRINNDGTRTVNLSDAAPWRSALGLGTSGAFPITVAQGGTGQTGLTYTSTVSSVATAASGCTVSGAIYGQYGKVAQLRLTIKCTSALSDSTYKTVANVVSGKRPFTQCSGTIYYPIGGVSIGYVSANGDVTVKGNFAANTEFIFSIMYLLP